MTRENTYARVCADIAELMRSTTTAREAEHLRRAAISTVTAIGAAIMEGGLREPVRADSDAVPSGDGSEATEG